MKKIIDFLGIKENMYSVNENGKVKNIVRNKYLSNSISGNGYYTIGLQMKDNMRKTFHIHILVATAFIPNPNSLPMVNHKDLIEIISKADLLLYFGMGKGLKADLDKENIKVEKAKFIYIEEILSEKV